MMVGMAFVFTSNTFVRKMQNLSHQTLKSKQGLFSIFWGIFAFETLKLLLGMDTWVFLKLIWKTFVSLLNFGMPPSEKRLCEIWIRVTHLFFIPYLICTNLFKCSKSEYLYKTAQNIRSGDNSNILLQRVIFCERYKYIYLHLHSTFFLSRGVLPFNRSINVSKSLDGNTLAKHKI